MQVLKTKYSNSELEEFKEIIVGKIATAKEARDFHLSSLTGTNNSSDSSTVTDGSITQEKEYHSQQAGRQQKFIEQLEAALVRIGNGTYGICHKTGELIPAERLRAVPHTTMCMKAKLEAA